MASTTDDKQKQKKKNVSRKTHRSIIRGMDDDQHAYILDLMRKTRLLQREAIYLNGMFYAERGYYPSYETAYEAISGTDAYKALNTDIAQATLKTLYDGYKTAYEHWKNGDKNARVPRQKSPRKPLTIAFTNRVAVNAKDGTILIPGKQNLKVPGETKEEAKARTERWRQEKEWRRIPLPTDLTDEEVAGITEVRLVPRMGGEEIELQLVIEVPVPEDAPRPKTVDEATRIVTVDPGLDNLMTCTAFDLTPGEEDVLGTRIYDGRELKSRNQLFNKAVKSMMLHIADLEREQPHRYRRRVNRTYDHMRRRYERRDRMLDWAMRTVAACFVRWCLSLGVEFVAFSWNEGFKQDLHMGRKANQAFSYIPLARLRDFVRDACLKAGIGFDTFEESYTSKASALAGDYMPRYGELSEEERGQVRFSGRRTHRGLYVVTLDGVRYELNADVNATINQLEKCRPGSRRALVGRLGRAGLVAAVSRPERERLLSEGRATTTRRRNAVRRAENGSNNEATVRSDNPNKKPLLQARP